MFRETLYSKIDEKTFNETEHFSAYHQYEKYDKTKKYDKEYFQADLGQGNHKYYNKLIVLRDNDYVVEYVVATEQISKDERAILAEYCPCRYCKATIFGKITMDPFYEQCLKYGNSTPQDHINEARKRLNAWEINPLNLMYKSAKSFFDGDLKK
jgi:hypothetical protein